MSSLILNSFVVFAFTLLITKSKIFVNKREFVEIRYESAKKMEHPGIIHKVWHAIWTCPMCSGFWFALVVSLCDRQVNIIWNTLILFSLNWLYHCVENFLFSAGELFEVLSDVTWSETFDRLHKLLANANRRPKNKI